MSVESALRAFGVAQVLVMLKDVPPGDSAALTVAQPKLDKVTSHFRSSENSRSSSLAKSSRSLEKPANPYRVYRNLGIILGTIDSNGFRKLKNDSAVAAVKEVPDLSLIRPVAKSQSAAVTGVTWGIKRINVDKLWARGIMGTGVIVGQLDTGVDGDHPALKTAIKAFAEFDAMGDQSPNAEPFDSGEHGTHTAGTIAGRAVNGSQFGVAPEAMLVSALVIEGGNVIARILGGMDWIIGEGARILNMSLGLRGYREDFLPLMQAIRNRGILPVIAVGNEGPGTSRSPGNYEIVLSVGACDETNRVADFSSSQRIVRKIDPQVPDLVAPGVDVLSAVPGGGFELMSGSSMATPHIAGLAALLWQAHPEATVDQVEAAILNSSTRPDTMSPDRANRGVPDAVKALDHLQQATLTRSARKKTTAKKTVAKKTVAKKTVAKKTAKKKTAVKNTAKKSAVKKKTAKKRSVKKRATKKKSVNKKGARKKK